MTVRSFFQNALLCVVTIIIVICIAETSLRAYHSVRWNTSFWSPFGGHDRTDEHFGWTPKEFISYTNNTVDQSGAPYHIEYKTYQYGFREWQKTNRLHKRVWFVGDSYTRAAQVSNDKAYYNIAKQYFPMDVFAFGGGGYSSLQEYLAIDKYLDEIEPELIVWQFTPNDFLDNDYILDLSIGGVGTGKRPYLIDGNIKYAFALPTLNRILFKIAENTSSQLVHLIHSRILPFMVDGKTKNLYREIEQSGTDHPGFARSYQTTQSIMQMVVRRVGGVKVVAFSVRDQPPFYQAFRDIMKDVGIDIIAEVPEELNAAETKGVEIRAMDGGHWNEKGHEIVGVAIAKGLNRLLKPEQLEFGTGRSGGSLRGDP